MMNPLFRACTAALLAGWGLSALAGPAPALPAALRGPDGPKYASMARCNTKDCHGADQAKGSPALNEYTLWKSADPHSKAFTNLYKAPSKAIGTAMGIAKVTDSARCLACHSKVVEAAQVVDGQKWSVQNGVSCEVCHGPSEKWIDPHATPKEKAWSHEKSVAAGMVDLRDPVPWTARCASCHLQIDHDMVTAGHPRLHFEIVDYNARTGAHWKTEKHPSMQAGFDSRIWTVGQAISFAEALRNLAKRV
ncbi:MAG TPA: multiheme c-type cytochrome, partial [Planctomycetota bacterium]|nr:multiheme c-type cytochrome [Planctomycetota bacterium]